MKFKHSLLFILICLCLTFSHAAKAAPARQAGFDQYNPPDLLKDFEVLRRRIRENPRDVAAINSIGIIYARAGKLEDAIRLWRHGLSVDPRYIHLYNNLGSALKQKGLRDEARLVFKTGLNFSASFCIGYNLGLLEKEEGNPAAAACGLATLRLLDADTYARVDAAARSVSALADEALSAAGVPHTVNRAGNLFSVFFTGTPVVDYASAKTQDTAAFGRFFHAMLDAGAWLPPSAYEAWFVSAAHGEKEFAHLADALAQGAAAAS